MRQTTGSFVFNSELSTLNSQLTMSKDELDKRLLICRSQSDQELAWARDWILGQGHDPAMAFYNRVNQVKDDPDADLVFRFATLGFSLALEAMASELKGTGLKIDRDHESH